MDLKGAYTSLKERKRAVEQELKERRSLRARELEKLKLKIQYVETDAQKLSTDLKGKQKELERTKELENYRSKQKSDKNGWLLFLCLGVVLILIGAVGSVGKLFLFVTGVGSLFAGFLRYRTRLRKDFPEEDVETIVRKLEWEVKRIREEYQEKEILLGNLREQLVEAGQKEDAIRQLELRGQAINLAIQRLEETAESMTREFGSRLNREASEILSAITGGKYDRLLIDEQLSMWVYDQGRRIPVERLSRGTLEQIYFSLRMAALNILYEEEIPVILDDAFVYYDEKRLKSVLKWLSEQPRQVIIFTCQRREEEIVRKL